MTARITIAAMISAAATFSALATPARAESGALDGWVKTVSKRITANLDQPTNTGHGSAVAIVRRTADGRAELVRMDCDKPSVARTTRIAVKKLRGLPPLPAGFEGQPIRVQVLLGDPSDPFGYYAELARMTADGERQNRMLAARVAGVQYAKADVR